MKYFWVNQGNTYLEEVAGSSLWAPHTSASGARLSHWDAIEKLKPGDVVFNYFHQHVRGYCIVRSEATPCEKPNIDSDYTPAQGGRIVFCEYRQLPATKGFAMDSILTNAELVSLLASGENPVLTSGINGAGQPVKRKAAEKYLCEIPADAGAILMDSLVSLGLQSNYGSAEPHPLKRTTALQLVAARIGQGKFRDDLLVAFENTCALSGLSRPELLRASHIKPWSESSDVERLSRENGLLLAAGIDAAFDRGYVSFDENGSLVTSLKAEEMVALGLHGGMRIPTKYLTADRRNFLRLHCHRHKFK